MEKSVNEFEWGLFFWQLSTIVISIAIIYFLVKLGNRMLKYYSKK